jgi:hypothetical protein
MINRTKSILLILTGVVVFSTSVHFGQKLWYSEDVKDGSGLPALCVVFGGSALGLTLIFWNNVTKTKIGVIVLIGMIATFVFMDQYQRRLRRDKIKAEGQKTFAIVTFRGRVLRGDSKGEEIRYQYSVNKKIFEKYATDEEYIISNNIKLNDTLSIKYWIKDPNYHDYKVKEKSH